MMLRVAGRATSSTSRAAVLSRFSARRCVHAGQTEGEKDTERDSGPREPWEQMSQRRFAVPTLEGYERPKGAPEQFDITREQYHQFTRGTKRTMDPELGNFLVGFGTMCWGVFACAGTMYLMRPDDFSWVDEEREKAAAAAERYKRIAEKTGVQLVDNSPTPLLPMLQGMEQDKGFPDTGVGGADIASRAGGQIRSGA